MHNVASCRDIREYKYDQSFLWDVRKTGSLMSKISLRRMPFHVSVVVLNFSVRQSVATRADFPEAGSRGHDGAPESLFPGAHAELLIRGVCFCN